ncbi:MAG: hypothetical protein A3G81_07385 [Betaproteobacteria bacterium RIFCSPLOWO2_12_FULL_65_14]|nr:MAG: hypothetical protein A3G81_07385 [Betaproteobacteria bacterium RIFCSPLOWO2_12_FULL_65_14]
MAHLQLGFDAYSPREIAEKVQLVGVTKARLPLVQTAMLGMIAGGFIGLGALFYTLVASDATLGFAATRVLGGLVFSLGLILVTVAGAELFTGNNLMVMAWADRKITTTELMRNWIIVYAANAVGAAGLAIVVYLANHGAMNGGAVGAAYVKIAAAKTALPFAEAFFKGVLCNLLVCLGFGSPSPATAWSTRSLPSCFRSRPSSPPASSTALPTCTSLRSACCSRTLAGRESWRTSCR